MTEAHSIPPGPGGPHYRRRLETQLTPLGGGLCEARARLEFHYPDGVLCRVYELTMRIDEATRIIVDARVPLFFAENDSCTAPLRRVQDLVGLHVLEKYMWRVHRIFGASSGCQHLLELSEEIGRAWFNRMTARVKLRMDVPDSADYSRLSEHCAGLPTEIDKLLGVA